jgi:hypothetical protein
MDAKEIVADLTKALTHVQGARNFLDKNLPLPADRKLQGISDVLKNLVRKIASENNQNSQVPEDSGSQM